jgi:hypothetical protein
MGDKDIHNLRVIKYREIILINSALCPLSLWKAFGVAFSIQCVVPATATIQRARMV